jgi:uncharacterized protein
MKWEDREESSNVEDGRGMNKTGIALGGGGIIIVLIALFLGVDPRQLLGLLGQQQGQNVPGQQVDEANADPAEEKLKHFTSVIFGDTERVWDEQFRGMGKVYERPVLHFYSGEVTSACGLAEAAVGPFYCPGDSRVYIDLSFHREMAERFHAGGEFAWAYVVAHEVGHHVQKLLGYSRQANQMRHAAQGRGEANNVSVRLELQADYLAGVWAYHGQRKFNFLEPGDVDTALRAAFEIGDDRLQKKARGTVMPDSFTHGTSRQRTRWFSQGLKTGDVSKARLLFELDYGQL